MNVRNYQKESDEIIKGLESVPTLLLHVCCAPCSSYVLEYLSKYFEVTVFFYNPNIEPASEYVLRLSELKRFIKTKPFPNPVHLVEGSYEPEVYREAIRGLEREKEGGKRCEACFRLRLGETAKLAEKGGFDYFTTTLSISPLKDAALLNRIGEEAGAYYGVRHFPSDFKKRDGYRRSVELSKEYGLYRQDYCGCVFSRAESEERRKRHEGGMEENQG